MHDSKQVYLCFDAAIMLIKIINSECVYKTKYILKDICEEIDINEDKKI